MADRNREDDWARQVPERRYRGPYQDYGWESGESALPEFRDPEVHRMPWDETPGRREGRPEGRERRGGRFEEAYDWEHGRDLYPEERGSRPDEGRMYGTHTAGDYYSPEMRSYESGYGVERYRRTEDWNVPGPYTGRGPKGYRRSNERIREDVADRLTEHGQVDATYIEVLVENGEVTLTGTVDSRRAKRLAEDLAESVTGVSDVHNQLRVQNQAPDSRLNPPPQSGS